MKRSSFLELKLKNILKDSRKHTSLSRIDALKMKKGKPLSKGNFVC